MIRIILPWPNPKLNPNHGFSKMGKYRLRQEQKNDAFLRTREHYTPLNEAAEFDLTFTFHPPGNYHYDDDNQIAALKGARDGIAAALGIDDKHFHTKQPVWAEKIKNGQVIVELEEQA